MLILGIAREVRDEAIHLVPHTAFSYLEHMVPLARWKYMGKGGIWVMKIHVNEQGMRRQRLFDEQGNRQRTEHIREG